MSDWFKRIFLSVAIFGLLAAAPAQAQNGPDRIKVLIGFDRTPGAADEALVRGVGGAVKYRYHLVPAIAANIPENAVAALLRSPRVTSVELDGEVHAIDAELDNTWGVKRIGAGEVHAGGNKGAGVGVAVIDSGIDYSHPELSGAYVDGRDFVNNDDDPMDDNDHGTHVSGTIAAADNDNDSSVVGVAPSVSLYGLKVLSASGSGYWSDIIAALQWVVDYNALYDPDIRITNNSYGSKGNPGGIVQTAFDNAYYNYGILHIAAAGNNGNCGGKGNNVGYPARFDSVVAVAATNSSDGSPCFSSTGPDLELAAPGVSIKSTVPGGGYAVWNGTSMASPHVAGAAALVAASNGALSNAQIRQRLVDTAIDLGPTGWDTYYGHGLIDVAAAVTSPGPVDTSPWVTMTSPPAGDVSGAGEAVSADAGDDNGVAQVEFLVDGVGIGTDTVGDGNGGWSVTWDTTLTCNGSHFVSAIATDDIGQPGTADPVTVNVANETDACPEPEPGTVSVGPIDPSLIDVNNDSSVSVTVSGTGFADGAVLTFEGGKGSAPTATNVVVVNETTLTATVSAKTKGKAGEHLFDVVVTNVDGSTATLPGGFTLKR